MSGTENGNGPEAVRHLVSIIVPVYNAEEFLNRTIESVLGQSYKDIELLLVNDGSIDSSEAICKDHALRDNRVRVITQENMGPAAARNTGIRQAAGEFAFFLDADDLIENNTIEQLIAGYDHSGSEMVMSNFSKLETGGEIISQDVAFRTGDGPFKGESRVLSKADVVEYVRHFLKHPSNHLISYCWARLYKLSILKENNIFSNEQMNLFEDFVFNLEYLKHADKVLFVNESLYTYVMHASHVSVSMSIVNSASLLHDMNVFRTEASGFLEQAGAGKMSASDIEREIGHALVHYVIIFLVRTCRLINSENRKKIYTEIDDLISAPIMKQSLPHYSPSKGNSRMVPFLMRSRAVNFLMFVCRRKALKRYGRLDSD